MPRIHLRRIKCNSICHIHDLVHGHDFVFAIFRRRFYFSVFERTALCEKLNFRRTNAALGSNWMQFEKSIILISWKMKWRNSTDFNLQMLTTQSFPPKKVFQIRRISINFMVYSIPFFSTSVDIPRSNNIKTYPKIVTEIFSLSFIHFALLRFCQVVEIHTIQNYANTNTR